MDLMSRIPAEILQKMLAPGRTAIQQLRRPSPGAVIPISRAGWQSAVADAEVADGVRRVATALSHCDNSGLVSSAKLLRTAVQDTVDSVTAMAQDLWCLDAFDACGGRGTALLDALADVCTIGLDVAGGFAPATEVQAAWQVAEGRLADVLAIADRHVFTDDPCQAAFGVPIDSLHDARGIFSRHRLLSKYYGRYPQLQWRVNSVLSVLSSSPPDLLDALAPAEALVLTDRPLIALRTAIRIKDLLLSKLDDDAEQLAQPLRALKLEVDRSATSHAGMVRVGEQLRSAETASDRAALTLDLYRRVIEGQLRPWSWALLQILGRRGMKVPEVSSLRDQLLSERSPLLRDAAEAILPVARNAAAHEDYVWDDNQRMLRVGDATVSIADLEAAFSRAYAFMAGAECAWRCARTESREFARLLDTEDPPGGVRAINARRAIDHFGTNGLAVRKWFIDGDMLSILLDGLPPSSINPCFQATMWASRHLTDVNRFVVKLSGRDIPAMDLGRRPLDACFMVWKEASVSFSVMPTSTFLPANAWARLAVELPDKAMQAIAWLAVNDAFHAYLDAEEQHGPLSERVATLNSRLHLIGTAVAATLTTLPVEMVRPLEEIFELVTAAASWNLPASIGLSSVPAADLEFRIRKLYMSYPVPAILPTVDARPLDWVDEIESSGTDS